MTTKYRIVNDSYEPTGLTQHVSFEGTLDQLIATYGSDQPIEHSWGYMSFAGKTYLEEETERGWRRCVDPRWTSGAAPKS